MRASGLAGFGFGVGRGQVELPEEIIPIQNIPLIERVDSRENLFANDSTVELNWPTFPVALPPLTPGLRSILTERNHSPASAALAVLALQRVGCALGIRPDPTTLESARACRSVDDVRRLLDVSYGEGWQAVARNLAGLPQLANSRTDRTHSVPPGKQTNTSLASQPVDSSEARVRGWIAYRGEGISRPWRLASEDRFDGSWVG